MFRARFEAALAADGIGEAAGRSEFLVGALWGVLSQIRLARRTTAGGAGGEGGGGDGAGVVMGATRMGGG